ncbi:hypothetical protein [Nocardiopsis synnemataformans]|uniref:hypothetical protein n=1 Tax=Nocardiopsis synnemataformans TaxID=61305 RepID=UPI003EBA4550
MYFHPPTLDPGPLATLIGLATLLLLLAQPLLLWPLTRRLGEPAVPGRPSPLTRLQLSQAAPMEVTMLDADGDPVRRPGR